jgi:TolB protein
MDADGGNVPLLTDHYSAQDWWPAWSPDGTRIIFQSNRDGTGYGEIYVMNADGSNATRLTDDDSARDEMPAWSP